MKRVYVICEGFTEHDFVHELLIPHFSTRNIFLFPRLLGMDGHKGGRVNNQRVLDDISILLNDSTAYCTTFFDFYGLPNSFFGKIDANSVQLPEEKAQKICLALKQAVKPDKARRFIPYIQMYEFEGLLFSDPQKLAKGVFQPQIAGKLQIIRDDKRFNTPEHINDSPFTAPSKRIQAIMDVYEKRTHGILAALEIGLPIMRQECPLFNAWLNQLEQLPALE
ncbi:MAG: DUF4276 family protein [bacterium]|nr:DUF4276 family protein [bacterium]